jgi:CheY-like chemotaxis protein
VIARILVVDDNALNAKLVRAVLAPCGYELITASDAHTALDLVRRLRPSVILMDLQLPGMSGLELTSVLKADPETSGIPILALTAYAMRGDETRALAAGCNAYMTKPIGTHALRAKVQELLLGPSGTGSGSP